MLTILNWCDVDIAPPEPPALVSPANNALISDTVITLTWAPSPSPDAVGYLLDWNGAIGDVGNVTQALVTVTADGSYTWTVAAYDQAGNTGAYTDTRSFSVDTTLPQIVASAPVSRAVNVPVIAPIVITFNEFVNAETFTYTVTPDPGGWSARWNGGTTTMPGGAVVTLTHAAFSGETVYIITVTAADDLAGNPLADAPVVWSFTTAAPPSTARKVFLPLILRSSN